ncbi:MAG: redoxin domain-containing protein [bacterium]
MGVLLEEVRRRRSASDPAPTSRSRTGALDIVSANALKFTGTCAHGILNGIGHNVPQDAPLKCAGVVIDVDAFHRGQRTMDGSNHSRRNFLGAAAGVGFAAAFGKLPFVNTNRAAERWSGALVDEGPMPELGGAVGWLNSPALSRESLRGKVVLVDIWTYSCINSLRQLPYLKYWAEKYKDAGLVVLGVHSPEFAFEKVRANVEEAVRAMRVTYPIAIDSAHGVWKAFNNEYWPADYFIDAKGRIRHHHFGEGDYDNSERILQELLQENGASGSSGGAFRVSAAGIEAPPDFATAHSSETYVGYARAEQFASPEEQARNARRTYSVPAALGLNQWALGGVWTVGAESGVAEEAKGRIAFRFHSRDLHVVLGPTKDGKPVAFTVRVDGVAPRDDHGADVDADGAGVVKEPRLYQLVRQKGRVADRTCEIAFADSGVQVFVFTFG